METIDKKVPSIDEKREHSKLSSMIRSDNVLASHRNIIKSFLVALKKPLALLQYLWVLSSSHPIHTVYEANSSSFPVPSKP